MQVSFPHESGVMVLTVVQHALLSSTRIQSRPAPAEPQHCGGLYRVKEY
jgi:hypothetical protein